MSALRTSDGGAAPPRTETALWVSVVDGGHGLAVRAEDLDLRLERQQDGYWEPVALAADPATGGSVARLTAGAGRYRLTLATGAYHAALGSRPPITDVSVTFWIAGTAPSHRISVGFTGHAQFIALFADQDEPGRPIAKETEEP